jgi:hypothetical protein
LNWGQAAINPTFASVGPAGGYAPVRQAYVTLRTPVGNGIDWKVGIFDGVTGYEGNTGYSNPNYTRSYGYQVNPASELGMIGSYKIIEGIVVQAGFAERGAALGVAGQASAGLSSKDYIATVALTAPDSWGFLKGSTLNLQTIQGFDNGAVNNYSASATIATPVTGLKVGLAYDSVQSLTPVFGTDNSWDGNIYGAYAIYQATDKLSFSARGEYVDASGTIKGAPNFEELTATVEYDLWANVVSRVEARWDHVEHTNLVAFNANKTADAFLLALNLVYKF